MSCCDRPEPQEEFEVVGITKDGKISTDGGQTWTPVTTRDLMEARKALKDKSEE